MNSYREEPQIEAFAGLKAETPPLSTSSTETAQMVAFQVLEIIEDCMKSLTSHPDLDNRAQSEMPAVPPLLTSLMHSRNIAMELRTQLAKLGRME